MKEQIHRIVEFMTPFPRTIDLDASLKSAADLMREYRIRHLPVTEGGRIVGVVSDRDLKSVITSSESAGDRVRSVMKDRPFCVDRNARVDEVVAKMAMARIGCALVIDDDAPVGIFTTVDACRALWEILQRLQNNWIDD